MVTPEHIGKTVTDGRRTGVLMDVVKDWENPAKPLPYRLPESRAFVRPLGGGIEWDTAPSDLELASRS